MKKKSAIPAVAALTVLSLIAGGKQWYEEKPYDQWKAKDVENMLTKSPWVETHIYTRSAAEAVITSAAQRRSRDLRSGGQDTDVQFRNYLRFQWFSAPPVRMALARAAMLANPSADREPLEKFATDPMTDAVLALMLDSTPAGSPHLRSINAALRELTLAKAAEDTYLEIKNGPKVQLKNYLPPSPSGDGTAKFVFPRTRPDGSPLLQPSNEEVRFYTQLSVPTAGGHDTIRVRLKYKLKDMLFQGKLVY